MKLREGAHSKVLRPTQVGCKLFFLLIIHIENGSNGEKT